MNEKILNFIIGILVGISLTTAVFLIYMKVSNNDMINRIPNRQENMMQIKEFDKNGGDFYKEEMRNFKNESNINREKGNEGDNDSNLKKSKGVPQSSIDSTNSN